MSCSNEIFQHVSFLATYLYSVAIFAGFVTGWYFHKITVDMKKLEKRSRKIEKNLDDEKKSIPSPKIEIVDEPDPIKDEAKQELNDLFDEMVGKKEVNPFFPVSKGGGYVKDETFKELNRTFTKERDEKIGMQSSIFKKFSNIEGMKFFQALGIVEEQGYTLHPLYVNDGKKNPVEEESDRIIGVKVKDISYNSLENKLSPRAVVERLVDVGGVDKYDNGLEK